MNAIKTVSMASIIIGLAAIFAFSFLIGNSLIFLICLIAFAFAVNLSGDPNSKFFSSEYKIVAGTFVPMGSAILGAVFAGLFNEPGILPNLRNLNLRAVNIGGAFGLFLVAILPLFIFRKSQNPKIDGIEKIDASNFVADLFLISVLFVLIWFGFSETDLDPTSSVRDTTLIAFCWSILAYLIFHLYEIVRRLRAYFRQSPAD